MAVMGSEDLQNSLKLACTLCCSATIVLRVRYGQVSGDIRSFGTARRAQARACRSTGARVTVVLMTFRVLAQGGDGVHMFSNHFSCSVLVSWFSNVCDPAIGSQLTV